MFSDKKIRQSYNIELQNQVTYEQAEIFLRNSYPKLNVAKPIFNAFDKRSMRSETPVYCPINGLLHQ
jgi:hypothetical protein